MKGKETEERMKMSFKKRSGASRKVEEVKDHRLVGSWGGVKVVDSRRYLIVDGNFVIPADDVHLSSLERSMKAVGWKRHEVWKQHNPIGRADYYDIVLRLEGGKVLRRNRCAAWTYPVGPHVYYLTTNFASFVKLMVFRLSFLHPPFLFASLVSN